MKPIDESLHETYAELKRIDHLIFVSLKYTRTVDVIISVVERMINLFNLLIDVLLEFYKEEGKIDNIQKSPGLKCDQLRSAADNEKINEMIDFYLLLRRIVRMEHDTINEYKRHVGLVVELDPGETLTVNIDLVTEYYERIKKYLEYINVEIISDFDDD